VNRLGSHLIELYSHRLVIGAEQYRRLTRRGARSVGTVEAEVGPLRVAVAGAKGVGRKALIEALDRARKRDLGPVRARLEAAGLDVEFADRLATIDWVEVSAYTVTSAVESARDRATRRAAVADAVEADLLVLAVDVASPDIAADLKFVEAWQQWYRDHPGLEAPPVLVVVVGADRPELGGPWKPPHDWARGQGARESAVRARVDTLRAALPAPGFAEVAVAGLGRGPGSHPDGQNGNELTEHGVAESVLPALALLLHRAERVAVIRHLHDLSARSKARRLISQLGKQGRRLWANRLAKK
ncbi:MAG TPA: GTPase, partial [Isosphaeraceae bacterium]|nr:GTPase [Isosphaeraceae bacterium]